MAFPALPVRSSGFQGSASSSTTVVGDVLASGRARIPGLLLCITIGAVAAGLASLETRTLGRAWLEPLVLAILVGAGVRAVAAPPQDCRAGVEFCGKFLLECAVMLLGASVSGAALAAAGPPLLLWVAAVVAVSIPGGYLIGRLLGLPHRMALLISCGNSICGNSAIAAIAPVIRADPKDVCAAIGFTAVLGVGVVLGLPLLAAAAGLSPRGLGVLAGLTVYAVPQVLAATASAGPVASQLGALVKLVRVLTLGPVILLISLLGRGAPGAPRVGLARLVPWFIVGFLVLLAARSAGVLSPADARPLGEAAKAMTVLSMAALGLGVDMGAVRRAGPRAILAVTLSLAALGALAFCLLRLLALW